MTERKAHCVAHMQHSLATCLGLPDAACAASIRLTSTGPAAYMSPAPPTAAAYSTSHCAACWTAKSTGRHQLCKRSAPVGRQAHHWKAYRRQQLQRARQQQAADG